MNDIHEIRQVAVMRSAFKQKYGIPRQPRLVQGLKSEVVFGDEFNNPDAVRGLEEFSHIWLGSALAVDLPSDSEVNQQTTGYAGVISIALASRKIPPMLS